MCATKHRCQRAPRGLAGTTPEPRRTQTRAEPKHAQLKQMPLQKPFARVPSYALRTISDPQECRATIAQRHKGVDNLLRSACVLVFLQTRQPVGQRVRGSALSRSWAGHLTAEPLKAFLKNHASFFLKTYWEAQQNNSKEKRR